MTEPVVALVVAAGSGVRLGASQPKALVPLAGESLLSHAVRSLVAGGVSHLVVVAPDEFVDDCRLACDGVSVPVLVVPGGSRRQDSVRAGLEAASDWPQAAGAATVLVHDAARPLVPATVVAAVIEAVSGGAVAVVPTLPVADSIRRVGADGSHVVDRADLRSVQTPQGFQREALVEAHARLLNDDVEVTDDAAACERLGHHVTLVPGSPAALKVTTPLDLVMASAVLAQRQGG